MPSSVRGLVLAALIIGGVAGGLVWTLAWAAGGSVRWWLVFAITICASLLIAWVARLTALGGADETAPGLRRAVPQAPPTDRERGGLERFERMLDKSMDDPGRFDFVVRQRLRELADHRLRSRYGVDSESDPARAHDLVGDQLWAAITTRTDQVPTRAQLTQWVTRLEQL